VAINVKDVLAYRWLQTEEMKGLSADVAAGVCFALSVKWAGRHKSDKNEGSEPRVKAITKNQADLQALQQRYQAAGGAPKDKESAFWGEAGFTVGDYEVKRVDPASEKSAAEAIAAMIIQAQKARHYTSLGWRGANGGHQMVCYHSNGKLGFFSHMYFFDPNGGEFVVPHDKISEFFEQYWFALRKAAKMMAITSITWAPLVNK
jgi:hypothetical protein